MRTDIRVRDLVEAEAVVLGRSLGDTACGLPAATEPFHPTLLVGMRNRLRASERPRRLFEDTVVRAKRAGWVKRRVRVVDSTPLLDAVATQDTVTQLRSAIRNVLRSAPAGASMKVRERLRRDDTYEHPGKTPCDWDDPEARETLVDELVQDAQVALECSPASSCLVRRKTMPSCLPWSPARMSRKVTTGASASCGARPAIASSPPLIPRPGTTTSRRPAGYKTHLAAGPDSEIITEVAITAANIPDRDVVDALIDEIDGGDDQSDQQDGSAEQSTQPLIIGDSAYADAATRSRLEARGIEVMAKVPPVRKHRSRSGHRDNARLTTR